MSIAVFYSDNTCRSLNVLVASLPGIDVSDVE